MDKGDLVVRPDQEATVSPSVENIKAMRLWVKNGYGVFTNVAPEK